MSTLVNTPLSIAATVTAAGALAAGAHTPVDATSGALTVTLPASPAQGAHLSVEKFDATTNAVTISGSLRGATTTIALVFKNETVELVADGSGSWWPVAGHKTKASLDAAYRITVTAESFGADPALSDNTAKINAALALGGTNPSVVTLRKPGTYILQDHLMIPSNTRFECGPGVMIQRASNAAKNVSLIRNVNVATTVSDHDIEIVGGIWDGNATTNTSAVTSDATTPLTGVQGNLAFIGVKNLVVRDLTVQNIRNHAIQILGTDMRVENISWGTGNLGFGDGVHVSGPSARLKINNISGYTHDDFVALTAWDWPVSSPTTGDITDVKITNLFPQLLAGQTINGAVVKFLPGTRSGTTGNVRNVTVSGVWGQAASNAFQVYYDAGDGTGASGVGTVSDVTIEDIHLSSITNSSNILTLANTADAITLKDVFFDTPSTTASYLVKQANGYTTSRLTIDGVQYSGTAGFDGLLLAQGQITELVMNNMHLMGVNNGTTNSGSDNCGIVVGSGGYIAKIVASNIIQKFGGSFIYNTSTASTSPMDVSLSSCNFDGVKRLLFAQKPVNLRASACSMTGLTVEIMRVDGATVNAKFQACDVTYNGGVPVTNINTGTVRVSGDVPIDVTKTIINGFAAGDVVQNSNGALACGAGRVVTDGTSWKNLFSGATY